MKKHTAKRIAPGYYIYRGYEIEQMIESEDKHWNIKPEGDTEWTDAMQSLKEAKIFINMLEAFPTNA